MKFFRGLIICLPSLLICGISMIPLQVTLQGVKMPRMLYGTAWKRERTADYVISALQAGFRGFDTACQPKHYEEGLVGAGLQYGMKSLHIKREQLFIQTKFTPLLGQDQNKVPYNKQSALYEQVHESLENSLSNLRVSYIDSLVLHDPMHTHKETMVVWREFEKFIQEGKVKQLGISNIYSLDRLKKLWRDATIKPAVVQNRFYSKNGVDKAIRLFCIERGIVYQSFWTLTGSPEVLNSKLLRKLSLKYSKTPQQIFLRFLTLLNITPLIGAKQRIHMDQDIETFDFNLQTEELIQLQKLLQ